MINAEVLTIIEKENQKFPSAKKDPVISGSLRQGNFFFFFKSYPTFSRQGQKSYISTLNSTGVGWARVYIKFRFERTNETLTLTLTLTLT